MTKKRSKRKQYGGMEGLKRMFLGTDEENTVGDKRTGDQPSETPNDQPLEEGNTPKDPVDTEAEQTTADTEEEQTTADTEEEQTTADTEEEQTTEPATETPAEENKPTDPGPGNNESYDPEEILNEIEIYLKENMTGNGEESVRVIKKIEEAVENFISKVEAFKDTIRGGGLDPTKIAATISQAKRLKGEAVKAKARAKEIKAKAEKVKGTLEAGNDILNAAKGIVEAIQNANEQLKSVLPENLIGKLQSLLNNKTETALALAKKYGGENILDGLPGPVTGYFYKSGGGTKRRKKTTRRKKSNRRKKTTRRKKSTRRKKTRTRRKKSTRKKTRTRGKKTTRRKKTRTRGKRRYRRN